MPIDLSPKEMVIVQSQFTKCDSIVVRPDVALVFPSALLQRDPGQIADRLQSAHDYLMKATPVGKSPKQFFGGHAGRIIVGYRNAEDEASKKPCTAGWFEPENRVNIPWERLTIPETTPIHVEIADQPEFTASHELIHPFEHIFLYNGNRNVKWNEAFCDGLRVMLLEAMGLDSYAKEWEAHIKAAAMRNGDKYHDAAGRLYLCLENRLDGRANMTKENLRSAIQKLISEDMTELLDPRGIIKF